MRTPLGLLGSNDCTQCHNTAPPFSGTQLPINHIPLPASPSCSTCHAAGYAPTLSIMVHSPCSTESCSLCHGKNNGPFAGTRPAPADSRSSRRAAWEPRAPPITSRWHHRLRACHAATDTESGTGFKLTSHPSAVLGRPHGGQCARRAATCHASAGMAWYGVTMVVPPGTVGTSGRPTTSRWARAIARPATASNFAVGGFKITTTPALAATGHAAVGSIVLRQLPRHGRRPGTGCRRW